MHVWSVYCTVHTQGTAVLWSCIHLPGATAVHAGRRLKLPSATSSPPPKVSLKLPQFRVALDKQQPHSLLHPTRAFFEPVTC